MIKSRGQSLIEGMVAMTIIITAVSSSLALVQSSIVATRIGGSQVVAANLAREGIEVVRAKRDSNWLAGQSFQVGLTDPASKVARISLDPATANWSIGFGNWTIASPEAALRLTTAGLFVRPEDGPSAAPTLYSRVVEIDYLCRNQGTGAERIEAGASATCTSVETLVGLALKSTVSYVSVAGSKRNLILEERLYDWR
jgi:phospholipase/lecithinase/hemolysin